jgi:hypothetical protein
MCLAYMLLGKNTTEMQSYALVSSLTSNAKAREETTRLVEKIPGLSTAAFSVLNPKAT